jgi:hypothetical protein
MCEQQFVLEVFEVGIIDLKASSQRAIGHPPLALEQVENLGEEVIEGHGEPSAERTSGIAHHNPFDTTLPS